MQGMAGTAKEVTAPDLILRGADELLKDLRHFLCG